MIESGQLGLGSFLAELEAFRVFRICHVLASVGEKGGLEKNVIELANCQAGQGHQVSAVADETMRQFFDPSVKFIAHPMAGGRLNPFNLGALRSRILEAFPEERDRNVPAIGH